eukprot:4531282-Prymnesium_polylepis.1
MCIRDRCGHARPPPPPSSSTTLGVCASLLHHQPRRRHALPLQVARGSAVPSARRQHAPAVGALADKFRHRTALAQRRDRERRSALQES